MTILSLEWSKINSKQLEMKNKNVQPFSRFRVTSPIHLLNPGSVISITDFAALKQWHCTCRLFLLLTCKSSPKYKIPLGKQHCSNQSRHNHPVKRWSTARKGAYAFASLEERSIFTYRLHYGPSRVRWQNTHSSARMLLYAQCILHSLVTNNQEITAIQGNNCLSPLYVFHSFPILL